MRLLLLEDARMIGEGLVKGLRDQAFAVDWVRNGAAAMAALQARRADFSAVVLDWNLPRRDGLAVLQAAPANVRGVGWRIGPRT